MRSLRDLDAELAKHKLIFGRKADKAILSRGLMTGSFLLHGSGGMGKTTLMLHALRDLGGMSTARQSGPSAVLDSGHSLYFEDLASFIQFLGVKKRPLTMLGASVTFRWDQGSGRKEASIPVRGRTGTGQEGRISTLAASSSTFQADRLVVRTSLDVAVGPRFDVEEIAKRVEAALLSFSEAIGRAVGRARRDPVMDRVDEGDRAVDGADDRLPRRLATALVRVIDGSAAAESREHGVVMNFLEEELAALVEESNREIYLDAASYLRTDDGPARRLSLREFEDGLQEFLENSNLDHLVPGELTFWRWYIGIDHLERGVPGWTLDVKKEAVRMIYDRMSEKDGFHVIMSVEPNPALIFDGDGPSTVSLARGGSDIPAMRVTMPPREEFVRESSAFITENVDGLNGMRKPDVHRVMGDLYDHCRDRIRLYYLVRSIKSLPALHAQGVEQVEPDASFLDRQLGEALGQLGVRYEYDMSIKNLPTVQPLLEMARMAESSCTGDAPTTSRNVFSWLLEAPGNEPSLSVARYLEVMESYGILRTNGDRVDFFDPFVAWELRLLSRTASRGDHPLVRAFQSMAHLNRFLAAMGQDDLLGMSGYMASVLSNWSATSRAEPRTYLILLSALEGGGDFPDRRRKITILAASAVLGGVPFSLDRQDLQRQKIAELLRDAAIGGDIGLAHLAARALRKMIELVGGRECVFCGSGMDDGQCVCASCRADYREICSSCGMRVSPHFAYCAGCGLAVAR